MISFLGALVSLFVVMPLAVGYISLIVFPLLSAIGGVSLVLLSTAKHFVQQL